MVFGSRLVFLIRSSAALIAKKAYKLGKPVIEVASEETDLSVAQLKKLLNPAKLTKGGISK